MARGRKRADYKCSISGRVCPFNEDFWELPSGDIAHDNCPIESYEGIPCFRTSDGAWVIPTDHCVHLIKRN